MAHTQACGNSTGPRCQCECGGWGHGGGAAAPPAPMPAAWTRTDPSEIADRAAGWFVSNPDVYKLLGSRGERAIRRALREHRPRSERRRLGSGKHLICGLLAEMADALKDVVTVPQVTAVGLADAAFPGSYRGIDRIRVAIMKRAITRLVTAMFEDSVVHQLEPVITALQAAAVATCPDPDGHAAVRSACEDLMTKQASQHATAVLERTFDPYQPHPTDHH